MPVTESQTGLTEEVVNGLRRALDLFQAQIDAAVRDGADPSMMLDPKESPVADIMAAQAWLARTTHLIHLEHIAEEEAR